MISVIVPMYNAQDTIERCLRSICQQTYKDIEIIVIDDGSADHSREVVELIAPEDPRIQYVWQNNQGASSARNHGIEVCKGDYLCFIDSDDTIDQNYLKMLYDKLMETSSDTCMCGFKEVFPETERSRVLTDRDYAQLQGTISSDFYLLREFVNSPCMKLYHSNIIKHNHVRFRDDMINAEDQFFNYCYYEYCKTVSFVNEPLYLYYQSDSGLSTKNSLRCYENDLENLRFKKKCLESWKVQHAEEILAQYICEITRRYMVLCDGKNDILSVCHRINQLNIIDKPVHLADPKDERLYYMISHRLVPLLFVYSRIKKGIRT